MENLINEGKYSFHPHGTAPQIPQISHPFGTDMTRAFFHVALCTQSCFLPTAQTPTLVLRGNPLFQLPCTKSWKISIKQHLKGGRKKNLAVSPCLFPLALPLISHVGCKVWDSCSRKESLWLLLLLNLPHHSIFILLLLASSILTTLPTEKVAYLLLAQNLPLVQNLPFFVTGFTQGDFLFSSRPGSLLQNTTQSHSALTDHGLCWGSMLFKGKNPEEHFV